MARRIPFKVTTTVKTGSRRARCVCGRVLSPNTRHTCSKTYRQVGSEFIVLSDQPQRAGLGTRARSLPEVSRPSGASASYRSP